MCLDTLQYHRQSDTCTTNLATLFAPSLEERLEYSRAFVFRNPGPGITELDDKTGWFPARTNRNDTAPRCELDRIRQQIIQHGPNFFLVCVHNYVIHLELELNVRGLQCQPLRTRNRDNLLADFKLAQR